jgi:hypothetical protein
MRKYFFQKNELDEIALSKMDLSEIKIYPGSDKGPLPEDDVDHYSRWFIENQPKSIYEGKKVVDFSDIGAKSRYLAMQRDDSEKME